MLIGSFEYMKMLNDMRTAEYANIDKEILVIPDLITKKMRVL